MSLAGIADETLAIIAAGSYEAPSGKVVTLKVQLDAAVAGTTLFRPDELERLVARPGGDGEAPRFEVTAETTAQASRRLAQHEGVANVVALNFASAKNAGGGFIRGAKAQEEDLARCSALYTCQLTQREYYDRNRASGSMLYTDHMIHSPDVPFFRDDRLTLLEEPFMVSVITAPAPNAGEALLRDPLAGPRIRGALESRSAKVLALAEARGHRCLVLGAWGCGVFRNQPAEVAEIFHAWLTGPRFRGAFDRVVFAVYDRSAEQATLRAFERQFA